ncbi:MAG TPA: AAA family ATPase [Chthoniobacterales bacterium]|jgi:hypothetical protein
MIETHISWVFIAAPFVFKVKKPVDLGFLDFSTLEKRHHFCRRELDLNGRLCSDVYLAVVPIYQNNAGFSFDDDGGEIAEYAVKMRELPANNSLGELIARGAVGNMEINRVLARLRRFYESQTPTPQIEEWGRLETLKISTDENFAQGQSSVGKTISPLAFDAIRHFTNNFYAAHRQLFDERIEQRRIRDCHGDLHLDHVHLTPDEVIIFDCMEFNDRFRFIDIANDLAFLAMDLDFERQHKLSDLLLRNAAREFGDPGMLQLADFYKCYRAFVRGKVESIQATSEEHAQRARRYFHLALRYATVGSQPIVLVVMGGIATGKSSIAKQLAQEMGFPFYSSDKIRKTVAGVPLTVRTPTELRAKVYSQATTDQTYRQLLRDAFAALEAHSGVILDATFSNQAERDLLRDKCAESGIGLRLIELQASPEQIIARLEARNAAAAEISDARLEDFEKLNAAYEAPSEFGDAITVASGETVLETTRAILLCLADRQSSSVKNSTVP